LQRKWQHEARRVITRSRASYWTASRAAWIKRRLQVKRLGEFEPVSAKLSQSDEPLPSATITKPS
jgi:hypothetical protein